jgi:hypothetical protein
MTPDTLLAEIYAINYHSLEVENVVHYALGTGGDNGGVYAFVGDIVLDDLRALGAAQVMVALDHGNFTVGFGNLCELLYVQGIPNAASRTDIYRYLLLH